MSTAIKHPVPGQVRPSFVIFWHSGTLTLSAERQSAKMSKKYKWRLNPAWHRMLYSCIHMETVGVKGLKQFDIWCSSFVFRWFLPARRYASAGNSDHNVSVRPSVCLSVTRRYCVKTKKASGTISSASGSPKTLVFWRQISSPNSKGVPPNGGSKQGSVGKIQRFF